MKAPRWNIVWMTDDRRWHVGIASTDQVASLLASRQTVYMSIEPA